MFSSPKTSFGTVILPLQTADSYGKQFRFLKRHQKRWLQTSVSHWEFDVQNKNSNCKVKITEPALVQKLVSQKFENTKNKIWEVMCVSKNTSRNPIEVFQLFSKTWVFGQILTVFTTNHSQQSSRKGERDLQNVISQLLKQKRGIWKKFYTQQFFSTVMNNQRPNGGVWKFRFYIPNTFRLWKSGASKKVKNTVATKGNCSLVLISCFIDETEKYNNNNKRSLDPSEHRKQRCLDF